MTTKPKFKIEDKFFDLDMPPVESGGCSILMLASGRAGKTTCIRYLISRYFGRHVGAVFSESARSPAYKNMKYPQLPMSSTFMPELINDAYRINKETKNHYPWFFCIDDCPLVKNDKEIVKLLTIYRNSGISCCVSVQSPTMLNATVRSNFTCVLLGAQNSTERIEQTIKVYLRGYFPQGWSYDEKIAEYKRLTADHHFILINNWTGEMFRTKVDLDDI